MSIALALGGAGRTQEEIGEQLGVTQQTLSRRLTQIAPDAEWAEDTDPLPDAAVLDRVAQALKDEATPATGTTSPRILATIFADEVWRAVPLREIARHTRIPDHRSPAL